MKLIEGVPASAGDPEHGISRGRLMPRHRIISEEECSAHTRRELEDSLVLVHGGMAQNVGPILEMVTEKYLLRSEAEWKGRLEALGILSEVLAALKRGDIPALAATTTRNFRDPIQTIIPWASTYYTELLIERTQQAFGRDFLGFWMLGGMSGGGMGFIFKPARKQEAQARLREIMVRTKAELQDALPFAMEPVVYDFAVNEVGTQANLLQGTTALMPPNYYTLVVPSLLRKDRRSLSPAYRLELDRFSSAARTQPELGGLVKTLFDVLLPRASGETHQGPTLPELLTRHGFDRTQHDQIRQDLREGRIGLAQNRLRADAVIQDVEQEDVTSFLESESGKARSSHPELSELGEASLRRGEVAVLTLAAGAGSRWTQGAGVCKALHPFCKLSGRHRTFIEAHLAKSRRLSRRFGVPIPHLFTTSYLTHEPIAAFLQREKNY
ncbi:MAG TPA: UTP--glucose-1-phosphate uridylyltransferase, partial [Myxococcota bacterium]|nr:UTP--glucose-1-phosphate uridylyltransferase [Myxococcota bacterium]